MKSVWNGTISFGLVSIPVRMYSAIEEHSLGFTLLCKKCHTPIKYERWCRKCHKEVAWADVVKGLKLSSGNYFIITQEKLHELKPTKTDRIEITEFITSEQLKLIYLEHHYYVGPEKLGLNAYFLFKKALEETNKVAIGQFVMRDKEYVCAITPHDQGLLLTTLNYSYEIRDMAAITELRVQPKVNSAELTLAEKLIAQLTNKKFNLAVYKDTFAQELAKAIKKGKKEKLPRQKTGRAKKEKSVTKTDLVATLKKSLVVPSKRGVRQPVARAKGRR